MDPTGHSAFDKLRAWVTEEASSAAELQLSTNAAACWLQRSTLSVGLPYS